MPSVNEWLFGSSPKLKQKPALGQGQLGFLDQIIQLLSGGGQGGGGYGQAFNTLQEYANPQSDVYKNFEAPYMQQFEQQTLPNIAERFAGRGALSSSGFGQALGGAGAQLQAQLAGLKSQVQQQSIGQILQQAGLGLGTQPFAYVEKPGSSGAVGPVLAGFAQGFGSAAAGGGRGGY